MEKHTRNLCLWLSQAERPVISQKKNPLVLAFLIHSKASGRVRHPIMCLLFSPSASIDSDHIHELYSQGLEVGFVSLKKDCLNFRNRSPKEKKKKNKTTTWAKIHESSMVCVSLAHFYDTIFGKSPTSQYKITIPLGQATELLDPTPLLPKCGPCPPRLQSLLSPAREPERQQSSGALEETPPQ